MATQGEHAGFGRAAAGQSDLLHLAGFFKRKVAFDLHKAKGVNVHVATDLQQLAAATVQIHGQFAGRARGHVQHRGARAEVDHRGVVGRAVDRHGHAIGGHCQAFYTHESGVAHIGLHAGPAAGWGGGGGAEFFGTQDNGKVHIAQTQTQRVGLATIDAGKGIDAAGAYAQLLHGHGVLGFVLVRRARQVGQGDGAVKLFNSKAA